MWANLSSYISQLPAGANPPLPFCSNGAVITPLYNLTHRLSQLQNRGYRMGGAGGGGGFRGKSGTESLFSKSRCWTLRGPFLCLAISALPTLSALVTCWEVFSWKKWEILFPHKEFQITEEINIWKKIVTTSILYSNESEENEPWFEVEMKLCWLSAQYVKS